ncbi:MAG TPA: NrsF family protein [Polyangiaceae bacterium]|nr:NrsF family protein [Polyangiaceae bacterium]
MSTPKPEPLPELADLPWAKPQCREEVSAAIRSACTKNLCPAQRMSARVRLTLCIAASSFVAAIGYWFGVRHNRSELGLRMGLLGALGWGIVQAAVLFMGFGPPRGRMSTRTVRLVLAVAVPVLFLGYLTFSAWSFVPFEQFSHGARASHALGCGSVALFFGALVSGGVLLAWRGTDPLTPRLSGTLAGLIGGVGGALAVGIGCPSHEAWHLWVSHGVIVLALGLMGCLAGRRLLAP